MTDDTPVQVEQRDREAVLDLDFANTPPIDWSPYDWSRFSAALSHRAQAEREGGEPVAWVSPGQFAAHPDCEPGDGGQYLPVRLTRDGNFMMPLFSAAPSPTDVDAGGVGERLREVLKRLRFEVDFQRGYGSDDIRVKRTDGDVILAALHPTPAGDADLIGELVEGLEDIAKQATDRIGDAVEMGTAVWRIALEDIAKDARALLALATPEQQEAKS